MGLDLLTIFLNMHDDGTVLLIISLLCFIYKLCSGFVFFIVLYHLQALFTFLRFWLVKILMVLGAIIGGFFLPWEQMATPWMVIGMICAFVFILIQLILLVDLAYSLNEYFLEKYEENDHKGWYFCELTVLKTVLKLLQFVTLYKHAHIRPVATRMRHEGIHNCGNYLA